MFHFDISGKDFNEEQFENIPRILFKLLVFQSEISGNNCNDEQFQNRMIISVTLSVFH